MEADETAKPNSELFENIKKPSKIIIGTSAAKKARPTPHRMNHSPQEGTIEAVRRRAIPNPQKEMEITLSLHGEQLLPQDKPPK